MATQDLQLVVQEGHYYEDQHGNVSKVLRREEKFLLALAEYGRVITTRAQATRVVCFVCLDVQREEFYVLADGRKCEAFPVDDIDDAVIRTRFNEEEDFIREVYPEDSLRARYEDDFMTNWVIEYRVTVTVKARARVEDDALEKLPSIEAIEKSLSPVFEATGLKVESVDENTGDVYEEDETDEE